MQAKNTHDQPFAIGSHRSCSLTSNSYVNSRCACASGSPLSMDSEFSGDCPPCSTSSFGGETDMMYMPAAGTFYSSSLVPPSKTDAADHVTVGPGWQLVSAAPAPPCSPRSLLLEGNRALQRPDQLSARPTLGIAKSGLLGNGQSLQTLGARAARAANWR